MTENKKETSRCDYQPYGKMLKTAQPKESEEKKNERKRIQVAFGKLLVKQKVNVKYRKKNYRTLVKKNCADVINRFLIKKVQKKDRKGTKSELPDRCVYAWSRPSASFVKKSDPLVLNVLRGVKEIAHVGRR